MLLSIQFRCQFECQANCCVFLWMTASWEAASQQNRCNLQHRKVYSSYICFHLQFWASSRHFCPKLLTVIHTLMAVATMQGPDQHIRSSLGFSILPKDTLTCWKRIWTSDLSITGCWFCPWAVATHSFISHIEILQHFTFVDRILFLILLCFSTNLLAPQWHTLSHSRLYS